MYKLFIALVLISTILAQDDTPTNTFGEDTENSPVLEYDKLKFDIEIKSSPHFVKFYAPWCGHCKNLEPIWEQLGVQFNVEGRQETVSIVKVDCTIHTELCSEQGVKGYPTLRFYNGETNEKYQGGRDLSSLTKFIFDSAGTIKSEDGLFTLNDDNFNEHIAEGHHFVKFYAPWCGHCQTLAPIWKSVASAVRSNKELPVQISHVDCTTSPIVCKLNGIKGYPTLVYFINGQMAEKYQGSRVEAKFLSFIEKMFGEEAISENSENKPEIIHGEVMIDDAAGEITRDGNVLVGAEDNFGQVIANHFTFVKFYAPWCGHCKGMAQDWKNLADYYSAKYEIKIAEVDCTRNNLICKKYEIDGYPTLILFDAGNKKIEYEYGRDFDSFVDFIKKETPINHDEL